MNKTAVIALALVAGTASAQVFNSDSLSGSASVVADTDIEFGGGINFFGLQELTLINTNDDFDLDETLTLGGSAAIDYSPDAIGLTDLNLEVSDFTFSASTSEQDSILFGAASSDVQIAINALGFENLTVTLNSPTGPASLAPDGSFTLENVDLNVNGEIFLDVSAFLNVGGLAAPIIAGLLPEGVMLPIDISFTQEDLGAAPGENLLIDFDFTLPSLNLETTLVGDQLTIVDTQMIDQMVIDELLNEALGIAFPLELADITVAVNAAVAGGLLDQATADELVSTLADLEDFITVDLSGFNASSEFTATFTIPAPGAVAFFGMAGLAAARRRRA